MISAKNVVHLHEDDLELYLRGGLEPERAPIAESHLLECERCKRTLLECLGQRLAFHAIKTPRSTAAQKRSEPRFDTSGEGTVQELHPLSLDRQKIRIVNMSKNGLGIVVPRAILPGTIVQLRIKDRVELGNVRYCSAPGHDGFRVGVWLHEEG